MMKQFKLGIVCIFIQAILVVSMASANDWATDSGGISEDNTAGLASATFQSTGVSGTGGTISATIALTMGTGNDGYDIYYPDETISPTITISTSESATAQIAIVIGSDPTSALIAYYDPDAPIGTNPWTVGTEVDFIVDGTRDINPFTLTGGVIASIIPGNQITPFGVFVQVMSSGGTIVASDGLHSWILGALDPPVYPWYSTADPDYYDPNGGMDPNDPYYDDPNGGMDPNDPYYDDPNGGMDPNGPNGGGTI